MIKILKSSKLLKYGITGRLYKITNKSRRGQGWDTNWSENSKEIPNAGILRKNWRLLEKSKIKVLQFTLYFRSVGLDTAGFTKTPPSCKI